MPTPVRVMFLCTGNCCRSQMAETLLRHLDSARFEVLSAGSAPAGFVHPLVYATLETMNLPVFEDQTSKSWTEVAEAGAVDLVITVCDAAAGEVCPLWPDRPPTVQWPLPDPSFVEGSPDDQLMFARRVAERLMLKLQHLVRLDWENRSAADLLPELQALADL